MLNNLEHLNPTTRGIINLSIEEKISYLHEEQWIEYPRSKEILSLLKDNLNRPKKARMNSLLIVGDSNIGKTTIISRFLDENKPYQSIAEDGCAIPIKPVIKALAPTKADEKSLYMAILESFMTPHNPNDTIARLKHQLYSLMHECNVSMIIIDEFHHLQSGTAMQQRNVLNAIKNISNHFMIPIVAVGMIESVSLLSADPQLTSRFDIIKIPKWNLDSDFRGLLKSFEKRLPLKEPSSLYGKEKATLLYSISQGNLGDLHRLLIECSQYALRNNIEHISVDIIKKFHWIKPTSSLVPREIKI